MGNVCKSSSFSPRKSRNLDSTALKNIFSPKSKNPYSIKDDTPDHDSNDTSTSSISSPHPKNFTREMIHPPPSPIVSIATSVGERSDSLSKGTSSSIQVSYNDHMIEYNNHKLNPSDTLNLIISYFIRQSFGIKSKKNSNYFLKNGFFIILTKCINLLNINEYKFLNNKLQKTYKFERINLASDNLDPDSLDNDYDTFDKYFIVLFNNGKAKILIKSDNYLRLIDRCKEEYLVFKQNSGFWYIDGNNEITVCGWLTKDYKNSKDVKTFNEYQFKESYSKSHLKKICLKSDE